jgi:hypothetical protein
MMNLSRRWLRDPVFLVGLAAGLIAFVVQSGDVGSADTTRRLQTTHSFWTSEPPVLPGDYPEFGLRGRGGKIYAWYGVGQSLLMLPADIVGTYLEKLPVFHNYNGNDPSVRDIVVSSSTSILINVLTAIVCLRFLSLLGFTAREAVAGVFALLACTTHLHYTQNMMENNYILLLTLTGFAFQYEWLRTGNRRALWIGSAALGLNLLTRLTTGMDLIAAGVFLLLVLRFEGATGGAIWQRSLPYLRIAAPIYAGFFLVDRLYQYDRFGSFFNTYISVFGSQQRQLQPSLPPSFPFETPFHVGFFGPLFTPEKSIFLFDPLLMLIILLAGLMWKWLDPDLRSYLVSMFLLLLGYLSFYARYTVWSGDSAWGDRYVATTVDLLAFIAVPLLLRYATKVGRVPRYVGIGLIVGSAAIQVASLAFWLPLEIYQMTSLAGPTFVVGLRFKNILAFSLGKMSQWGLTNSDMLTDPWDYVHITTWNFLPFVLRRVGEAPGWVVRTAFVIWGFALALLGCTLWQIWRVLANSRGEGPREQRRSRLASHV